MSQVRGRSLVLVVDDEPLLREAISARLRRSGFETVAASSAEEAYEAVHQIHPDAVVLDICMPGISGFELLDRLRAEEDTRLLPVVLLSALSDTDHIVHGLQRGATDYVVKPPSIPLLVARLNAEIERFEHLRQAEERVRTMEHLALHDELTSLYNRRAINEALETEMLRGRRYERPLSVLMIDLDHFKTINDTYGHGVGDEILRQIARRLTSTLRATDVVGRYGGEEFLAVLPETAAEAAARAAENVRLAVESQPFLTSAGPLSLTVSIGVAAAVADEPHAPDDLIRQADEALYEAKRAGRNRVQIYAASASRTQLAG